VPAPSTYYTIYVYRRVEEEYCNTEVRKMAQVRDFKECVSKALPNLVEDLEKLKHEVKDLWSIAEDLRYKPPASGLVHKVNRGVSGLTKAIAITKVSSAINKHLKACFGRGIGNTAKRFLAYTLRAGSTTRSRQRNSPRS
jgi:hypothetical protein